MIQFAPLNVPLERRIQTACTLFATLLPHIWILLSLLILYSSFWWTLLPYFIWIALDDAPRRGGRWNAAMRQSAFWKHTAAFFPVKLVREVALSPDQRYIFAVHPHGFLPMGALLSFMTEATGFSSLFPGIRTFVGTIRHNFWVPFYREILLGCGVVDVAKTSCHYVLRTPGRAMAIFPGGALEALESRPGTFDLRLRSKKGFVKLALETGAWLVPVFSFGETDLWEQVPNPKGSILRRIQEAAPRFIGISMPLYFGRGVFQYTFGLLPHRHPIVTVVGKPIEVIQVTRPTKQLVQDLHERYMTELKALFDRHKDTYAPNRRRSISVVDDDED